MRHAAVAYVRADGSPQDTVALNPALTDLGRAQAEAVAERLRMAGISRLYSSPAVRCLQTAQAICAAAGIRGTAVPWLGEHGRLWQDWERRPPERIPEDFPALEAGAPPEEADWGAAREEASESPEGRRAALHARSRRVLDLLFDAHARASAERVCLCVHHGIGGYGLLPVLLGTAETENGRFVLDHASLTQVRCNERGNLILYVNSTRHLAGLTTVICSNAACDHRSPHREERTCRRCGAPMLFECPTCHTDIPAVTGGSCPHCGRAYRG